jgi:hypothetical protein
MLAAPALSLCLAVLTQAGPRPALPEVLRGVVVEKGTGRPMAGASVRFSDAPDGPAATTDDQGRFDGLPVERLNAVPVDGRSGPPGRVRAEDDRAWPWDLVVAGSLSHDPRRNAHFEESPGCLGIKGVIAPAP